MVGTYAGIIIAIDLAELLKCFGPRTCVGFVDMAKQPSTIGVNTSVANRWIHDLGRAESLSEKAAVFCKTLAHSNWERRLKLFIMAVGSAMLFKQVYGSSSPARRWVISRCESTSPLNKKRKKLGQPHKTNRLRLRFAAMWWHKRPSIAAHPPSIVQWAPLGRAPVMGFTKAPQPPATECGPHAAQGVHGTAFYAAGQATPG